MSSRNRCPKIVWLLHRAYHKGRKRSRVEGITEISNMEALNANRGLHGWEWGVKVDDVEARTRPSHELRRGSETGHSW